MLDLLPESSSKNNSKQLREVVIDVLSVSNEQ
jgi:hypothetical protein